MTALRVTNVNLELNANKNAHNTSDYDNESLIVRRGQPIAATLTCNRAPQSRDSITFIAQIGPRPSESNNTKKVFKLSSSASGSGSWSATQQSSGSSTVKISILTDPNAIIGWYKLSAQIVSNGTSSSVPIGDFILLYNCWIPEDAVYMANAAERAEFVMSEIGLIFVGSANNYSSRAWDLGQFEYGILPICLKLLDSSLEYRRDPIKDLARRNDPIYVSRVISAMVNSNDDKGVLLGRWDNKYSDGVSPTAWNGSISILRQWNSSGPVRYGQCWVFAGVMCTVLRALGMPSRIITNFESAHDTDRNLTIDQYYDQNGKSLGGDDSVWNFHVWNECWFTRPDLGSNYDGWQITDATPQEPSEGVFRLGPASRTAVKEGDVQNSYDTAFVYAEINADRVQYIVSDDGTKNKIYTDTRSVGQLISTKKVGQISRDDVTKLYKYDEGSTQERDIYKKAVANLSKPHMAFRAMSLAKEEAAALKPTFSGKYEVVGPLEVGKDVNVNLVMKNEAPDTKSLTIAFDATSVVYTNKTINPIMTSSNSLSLGPNEEKRLLITIPYARYDEPLTEDNMIKISAVCEDDKGGKSLVTKTLVLTSPPLLIKISGDQKLGEPIKVDIQFANTIDEAVQDCKLVVEGSGILRNQIEINTQGLKPNQRQRTRFDVTPYRPGKRAILCNFSANKFSNIKGSEFLDVKH